MKDMNESIDREEDSVNDEEMPVKREEARLEDQHRSVKPGNASPMRREGAI